MILADIKATDGTRYMIVAAGGSPPEAVVVVMNNAGIYPFALLEDLDAATWRRTFAVNVEAHFHAAKAFVPLMRRHRWGRFVNVSSNSIAYAAPGLSHYMASKMAVLGFVRGLANEVGGA